MQMPTEIDDDNDADDDDDDSLPGDSRPQLPKSRSHAASVVPSSASYCSTISFPSWKYTPSPVVKAS